MRALEGLDTHAPTQIPEPPVSRFLFADTRMAWFWLLLRLYAGYEWFTAGFEKVFGTSINFGSFGEKSSSWIFTSTPGTALQGFVRSALGKAGGDHPSVSGWYAWFLQNVVLPNAGVFAYLIAFGELLVGLGLLVGALTGIAAFFGVVMNFNYLLAGTVSINPLLAIVGLLIMMAWRVAGYYGLDRYLLPLLGTPWWSGSLARRTATKRNSQEPPEQSTAGTAPA
ncbi:MAG: hypothetical protein OJF49_001277 [Ktedonobacterales bacterium]|jgi:thiosulfate dehydrogenase [quinone] large subunit|nr:MAG: hypothetical protein OJF49_001277 [Ktedonobacterales bacterium]